MDLFRSERNLLETRGSFIIRFVSTVRKEHDSTVADPSRQLCMLLSPEDIYKTLSQTLATETDAAFASVVVKILSSILLTSTELHDLRLKLKNLQSTESAELFVCLYKTWCHNPIALVALCFLSQNYDHACTLVQLLCDKSMDEFVLCYHHSDLVLISKSLSIFSLKSIN
jgi:vacuole morphology and inheritance protein 14